LRIRVNAGVCEIDRVDFVAVFAEEMKVGPAKLDIGPNPVLAGGIGAEQPAGFENGRGFEVAFDDGCERDGLVFGVVVSRGLTLVASCARSGTAAARGVDVGLEKHDLAGGRASLPQVEVFLE
jgi:hypothetical protein